MINVVTLIFIYVLQVACNMGSYIDCKFTHLCRINFLHFRLAYSFCVTVFTEEVNGTNTSVAQSPVALSTALVKNVMWHL